jgi:hypothetical protein
MYTENTENRDFMYECTKQVKFDLKDLKYDKIFVHFGRNRSFFEQTGKKNIKLWCPKLQTTKFLAHLAEFF